MSGDLNLGGETHSVPGAKTFRHVGISVSDIEKSLRFYVEYLNFEPLRSHLSQSGPYISSLVGLEDAEVDIRILKCSDGSLLELLHYKSHMKIAGKNAQASEVGRPHLAFSVRDLQALYARREEFGVFFKSVPLNSPDAPVLVAYCHDPDGTIIELVEVIGDPS